MVTPIEVFIVTLRDAGITLVLLWTLTLALVWGLLSYVKLSGAVRGIIALAAAFLVLLAAAASPAVAFLQNLITSTVVIAFGLLIAVVFLEIIGAKDIFSKNPKVFGIVIILLLIAIFIGAGGLGVVGLPKINLDESVIAFLIFGFVIIAAVTIMLKEVGGEKK